MNMNGEQGLHKGYVDWIKIKGNKNKTKYQIFLAGIEYAANNNPQYIAKQEMRNETSLCREGMSKVLSKQEMNTHVECGETLHRIAESHEELRRKLEVATKALSRINECGCGDCACAEYAKQALEEIKVKS